ncbi:adenosylcobinamide-GDP ribazoletransferase [Sphaerotilus microaerophilus]|uniref:Adenosylcobinamide-GDP ribazoletransferase n=1 Tax=Sphaerotilus microaerophilus TaxID=2914710 RepID=A0ABM7YKR3_9BURK|nr:adenosylcobinamide-GDP ribazoletransferase [Sphaerotilus sp. FB-5]BDI04911.1 adenosylcobinamide-GDP ribazoletransferase [Sphaerotilus sp. FB-5]
MGHLARELRLFLIALQFFTRVPVTGRLADWVGWSPEAMHASARHYPAVGLLVGAFSALLLAAAQLWPLPVAVGLAMAGSVWLTGGFHEDGLADTCDGLGGAVSRERALTIMKDSRLGSYGALGLVFVLGLKAAALHGLAVQSLPLAAALLVWAHAASRALPVALLWLLPYAGDVEHAKAKPMAQQISGAGLAVALGWVALATGALVVVLGAWGLPLAALVGLIGMGAWCARWYRRRLGGFTGDTLGAAQQLGELAAYLGALALLPLMPPMGGAHG